MESLDYNYFEIDNNIVIARRIINTPQDYAKYNLTRRLQEWLPKRFITSRDKSMLNELGDSEDAKGSVKWKRCDC